MVADFYFLNKLSLKFKKGFEPKERKFNLRKRRSTSGLVEVQPL